MADLYKAATAYQEKFGDVPTLSGLSDAARDEAATLLTRAVADDAPFEDDAAWYAALGLDPPPDGALV